MVKRKSLSAMFAMLRSAFAMLRPVRGLSFPPSCVIIGLLGAR